MHLVGRDVRIKVLGTAAGGGIPQWNCDCPNCTAVRSGRLPSRRVASLAVTGDGQRWILVNAGCDISAQLAATPSLWPTRKRSSPIAALLLTDANIDHTAGLLEFRQAPAFSIWSTTLVKDTLTAAPMFARFANSPHSWRTFDAKPEAARCDLPEIDGLTISAIPVPGRLPSYAGDAQHASATVAYRFEHMGASAVYAPIFLAVDDKLKREAASADAVFLDGTCWTDDEMIQCGLGTRTARDMGHAPMIGPGGSLDDMRRIRARYRYYTHVNNSNPILDPASAQASELAAAGFAVPDDGLEIVLDGDHATDVYSRADEVR